MSRLLSCIAPVLGLLLLAGASGCSKKSDPGPKLPTVRTDTATDITYHSAKVTVTILTEGGASALGGVAYAKTPGPTLCDFIAPGSGAGTGSFTVNLPDLQANTCYYYRAYASDSVGTVYGAEKCFVTSNDRRPTSASCRTPLPSRKQSSPSSAMWTAAELLPSVRSASCWVPSPIFRTPPKSMPRHSWVELPPDLPACYPGCGTMPGCVPETNARPLVPSSPFSPQLPARTQQYGHLTPTYVVRTPLNRHPVSEAVSCNGTPKGTG